MRFAIPPALAALSMAIAALDLTACGSKQGADSNVSTDDSLSAQNIVTNDVTAIDAVTGDAANMAADVEFSNALVTESETADAPVGDVKKSPPGANAKKSSPAKPSTTPGAAAEPAAKSATAAPTNTSTGE